MYLCGNRNLRRYKINTDGSLSGEETLINDLPNGGQLCGI